MKITDYEIIQNGERELIDSINGDLDWEVMEEIFQKEHKLDFGEDVEYKRGDIVVHDNEVAYRLEFDVKVNLSILIDREGNYLSFSTAGDPCEIKGNNENEPADEPRDTVAPDDGEEGEQGKDHAKNALEKIDSTEHTPAFAMPENPKDRISQAAAQAGDVMDEINNDIS